MKLSYDETKILERLASALAYFITRSFNFRNDASFNASQQLHSKIYDSLTEILTSTHADFDIRLQQQNPFNTPNNLKKAHTE